jgi:hypothetical protein
MKLVESIAQVFKGFLCILVIVCISALLCADPKAQIDGI